MLVDFGQAAVGMASAAWMQPQPVLAQVVFGGNPAAFLGIALAVGGAGLYFLRNFRPQVARDQDIALSAVSLLCGTILMFQGWRLDPILTFGFYLMAGAATAFALETLRLRGATTEQAKRFGGGGQIVDDERPVSRVYRAELDELGAVDERPASRRIRASRDYRTEPTEDYGSSSRRPAIRGSADRPTSSGRRRRSSSGETRPPVRPERDAWEDDYGASSYGRDRSWEEPSTDYTSDYSSDYSGDYSSDYASGYSASDYASSRGSSRSSSREAGSRPRRPRSVEDVNARWEEDEPARPSADYVDYQPVDYSDDEADNSSNFD